MRRDELEHLIRASAELVQDDEIVVVGSQALLASATEAPPSMLVSIAGSDRHDPPGAHS